MPTDESDETIPTHAELSGLMRPGALVAKLEQSFPKASISRVQISLVHGASSCHAVYAGDACAATELAPTPTGCLTKLLTTTLAHLAIAEGRFELDSEVPRLLAEIRCPKLNGMTVRHLLEHTHGLDDSGVARAPLTRDGLIDRPQLAAQLLRSPPLAEPGLLYSYSNAGAWLIAALLEHVYATPYRSLLRTRLFDRIAAEVRFQGEPRSGFARHEICPATGNDLAVSLEDVTRLLRAVLPEKGQDRLYMGWSTSKAPTTPLPGWHSTEIGIRLGWKDYGSGWFGHNSEHVGAAALLRVHPQWRVGVFITAASPSPMSIGATLLREALPGFVNTRMPKLLRDGQLNALDPRRYAGRYANATTEVEVLPGAAQGLQLNAYAKDGGSLAPQPFFTARLHAAQQETFFPLPADPVSFPFVQFLGPTTEELRYLWNGKTLRPRT